jgi:hypothetical protein
MRVKRGFNYPKWVLLMIPFFIGLHQSSFFWNDSRLVLGLPVSLFYHVALSVFLSVIMLLVVKRAWPRYLDRE